MDNSKYTMFGVAAVIIWGTSSAFTRTLGLELGAYTAAAVTSIAGGIIALFFQISRGGLRVFRGAPRRYWVICGILFLVYTASSYLSMSVIKDESSIMVLVLIRFLWPLFTLLLTIPMLGEKATGWLAAAVAVSLLGIALSTYDGSQGSLAGIIATVKSEWAAYLLGFAMSVSWAFYNVLTKKYIGGKQVDGSGWYMLVTGLLLGIASLFTNEPRAFSMDSMGGLIYQAVAVSFMATILWNISIKRGSIIIVVLVSNFLPLISVITTSLLLGIPVSAATLTGGLFVAMGSIWCKHCFEKAAVKTEAAT